MIERKLEPIIVEMLDYFRVVAINGPRQSGKTTLQKKIAEERGMAYYTFDKRETYETASNDPEGFIAYIAKEKSVAIDEVQMVPEIIPAIKLAVDEADRKGMFLLTGSSDLFKNARIKESLAGRMASLTLYPLSYAEIHHRDTNLVDALFGDGFNRIPFDNTLTKEDVVRAVVQGGYPEAYTLPPKARQAWYDFYITSRITKDIATIEHVDLEKVMYLDALLKVLASQTASLVNYSHIANAVGLADKTVKKYIRLLEALYIVELVPAYANNRLKRVIKSPKVHFIDSGLASYLLGAGVESLMLGTNSSLGSLMETFVYSELVKHASSARESVKIYYYRDQQQREVDFVLESLTGAIVAIEVKSGSNLKKEHFKGLLALAKSLKGKEFKGILLYSGTEILPFRMEAYQFWAIPLQVFL